MQGITRRLQSEYPSRFHSSLRIRIPSLTTKKRVMVHQDTARFAAGDSFDDFEKVCNISISHGGWAAAAPGNRATNEKITFQSENRGGTVWLTPYEEH